jgi:hypothetical protein
MRRFNFILLSLGLIFLFACQKKVEKKENGEETTPKPKTETKYEYLGEEAIDAASLKKTVVLPHIEAEIPEGKSVIYCSTFQLAWNELINNVVEKDVEVENGPYWTYNLNKQIGDKDDLTAEYYVANAGYISDGIVEKINEELEAKFQKSYEPSVPLSDSGIIAYSYLFKNLKFMDEFEPDFYLNFNEEKEVKSFGIKAEANPYTGYLKTRSCILYDYKNDDDFILQVRLKNSSDEIYLAKVEPGKTIYETYYNVLERATQENKVEITADDEIRVPVLEYKLNRSYDELIGKTILGFKNNIYYFLVAQQMIRFEMNEKGVELESEVEMAAECEEEPDFENLPKKLFYDKPFLIILKEKNAEHPYFLMWVNNAELMQDY